LVILTGQKPFLISVKALTANASVAADDKLLHGLHVDNIEITTNSDG